MLRKQLAESLADAMRARDKLKTGTLRLILAAIKDRDIASRDGDNHDGVSDEEILQILQKMVRQRRESIVTYEEAGRAELAEQELAEIVVIEDFLPRQMEPSEIDEAVKATVADLGCESIRDMGKLMSALRDKYNGQMDFGKASGLAKEMLQ
ncbi:MAG: GatB/YqeY domain-containing protein [Alphaproteobacteria bacterium]|nr:MAG: GatB/YqeY domain-containing protein [Alphaproteobacteria bacterium]